MKRFLVSILMVLYMAGAMGATVHMHYCMGDLVGASLLHHDEHKCDRCGMVKRTDDNGCCKDEHKTFKTTEHSKTTNDLQLLQFSEAVIPPVTHYTRYSTAPVIADRHTPVRANAPPPWHGCPIYIRVRNLRI